MMQRRKEETAIVLDFLVNGYASDPTPSHLKKPIAQAIGTSSFVLLELVPKKGIFLQPLENVYIGESKRDKIHHINGKLHFDRLTSTAKSELEHAIIVLVKEQEARFVNFFNTAQPLNTRMHIIELLPGVGKKHMVEIVEQRKEEPFKSFEDVKKRVKLISNPEKIIAKRIFEELSGKEKHYLFVGR